MTVVAVAMVAGSSVTANAAKLPSPAGDQGQAPPTPLATAMRQVSDPAGAAAKDGAGTAARPHLPVAGVAAVPREQRDQAQGKGWERSADRAWTTSGDAAGLHILVADADEGYAWRTATTLSEPGVEADSWIGNACLTGDGRTLAVAYAPRAFTNHAELNERGAFTATVDLITGEVSKLPVRSSLAYFSPACGPGATALVTQEGGERYDATRIFSIDARTRRVSAPVEVPGQLTSAVPAPGGIVAADSGALVKVAADGTRRVLAPTSGVAYGLTVARDGSVAYLERSGATVAQVRVLPPAQVAAGRRTAAPKAVARGGLMSLGLAPAAAGPVTILGDATVTGALPAGLQVVDSEVSSRVSSTGALVVEPPLRRTLGAAAGPAGSDTPVAIEGRLVRSGVDLTFAVQPAPQHADDGMAPAAAGGSEAAPRRASRAAVAQAGSPTELAESERYCSVPRNDPRNQTMQPKPRQVEWAVDQAVRGALTVSRGANWKGLGMPAYTPQGLFPPRSLSGGGNVPAQVFLGVLAQESNLWQAARFAVPGVTGNPLIGNYYGIDYYDDNAANDWTINWADADCGYGVAQVTDGMRLAGRGRPNEQLLPYQTQRAVALDFAANVAAGLQILQDKWNQTRTAGLTINNGDPSKIENWFFAVWAYNSGLHPQAAAGEHNGAWGLGWLNNPANPRYPANRAPFLEHTYQDAAHPQDWPYPEKVMGWAGHPVEVLEAPNTLVAGFRPAWWNGDATTGPANRAAVKPPVNQFCDTSNMCVPGARYTPDAPDVVGERAGPCAHRNGAGQYDLKCWYHQPSTWKPNCNLTCGNELLRFDPGYAYQEDGAAYPPQCTTSGLPAGARIIDDVPDGTPSIRPDCPRNWTNAGTFTMSYAADARGNYPGKVDTHQIGAGFGGHFWFAHTRDARYLRGGILRATGTWTFTQLNSWGRVLVHVPDHGANTQQAVYTIDLGDGSTPKRRMKMQRIGRNGWVNLGVFKFGGTPKISLSNETVEMADGVAEGKGDVDIAWDAAAIVPLAAKPKHVVVAMGDSYSSGEGASQDGGANYYPETDIDGDKRHLTNACHRSRSAWARQGTLGDVPAETIGSRADRLDASMDFQFIACSGAETEDILSAAGPAKNAWDQFGGKQFGTLPQLDQGYLDENTTLVTLSIGGNDARFAKIVAKCDNFVAEFDPCQDFALEGEAGSLSVTEPDVIRGGVRTSIETTLREIQRRAPNAKIVLMGYPWILAPDGWSAADRFGCTFGIITDEMRWMNEMVDLLAVQEAELARSLTSSGAAAVTYADARRDFGGNGACASSGALIHSEVKTRTRADAPFSTDNPVSRESFHPNVMGATAYSRTLIRALTSMGL